MTEFASVKALHATLPPFLPLISVGLLPYIALILLSATFTLAFYFTTLPKATVSLAEVRVATLASILGRFGVVALFCTIGVPI